MKKQQVAQRHRQQWVRSKDMDSTSSPRSTSRSSRWTRGATTIFETFISRSINNNRKPTSSSCSWRKLNRPGASFGVRPPHATWCPSTWPAAQHSCWHHRANDEGECNNVWSRASTTRSSTTEVQRTSAFHAHPCKGPNNDRSLTTNYAAAHHYNWKNNIDDRHNVTTCGAVIATVPVKLLLRQESQQQHQHHCMHLGQLHCLHWRHPQQPQIGMLTNRMTDALRHRHQQQWSVSSWGDATTAIFGIILQRQASELTSSSTSMARTWSTTTTQLFWRSTS